MSDSQELHSTDPSLFTSVREGLRENDITGRVKREFRDVRDFFIDEDRKRRLENMGWFRRWWYTLWWLFKSLFLKLTPLRRLLLIFGVIFVLASRTVGYSGDGFRIQNDSNILGVALILFVLLLELKDKLVAREELMAGYAVQRALMPEPNPRIRGWDVWLYTRPANEVGGDFVDYLRLSPDRSVIGMGDVAGKGLRAALFTAKLQASWRALLPYASSLGDLAVKLNEILYRDRVSNTFASLISLGLDYGEGTIEILNAGHLPPVVIRGSTLEQLPKGSQALGLTPQAVFVEQHVDLGSGDILLVYSDGVTEARNEAGEFYSEHRLMELLQGVRGKSSRSVGESILGEVNRYVGNAPAHDDLSLIVLQMI